MQKEIKCFDNIYSKQKTIHTGEKPFRENKTVNDKVINLLVSLEDGERIHSGKYRDYYCNLAR